MNLSEGLLRIFLLWLWFVLTIDSFIGFPGVLLVRKALEGIGSCFLTQVIRFGEGYQGPGAPLLVGAAQRSFGGIHRR